jgi:hypothetical protein
MGFLLITVFSWSCVTIGPQAATKDLVDEFGERDAFAQCLFFQARKKVIVNFDNGSHKGILNITIFRTYP